MRVRRVGPALVLVAGLALGSIQTSSASINWPIKVFTVSTPLAQRQEALANPYVSGLSIRVPWKRAEPSPGVYRWDAIDQALAQARAAGKLLMIRILAGIFTPDWVDAQVPTLTFSNAYLYNPKAYPSTATMPVPWDPRFLSLWRGFVDALGARYDGDPTIYSVQMAGAGFIGEMTLPTDVGTWLAARYSDGMMIFAWESIIWEFRTAFPHTPLNLDITAPFPPPLHQTDVFGPVSTFAITGTQKAYIQGNALRPEMLGQLGPYRRVVRASSAVTGVGYQMIGVEGTPDELMRCFQVAVEDSVDYVEVYGANVVDPNDQAALRYLASAGTG